jgi:hypothetical protein
MSESFKVHQPARKAAVTGGSQPLPRDLRQRRVAEAAERAKREAEERRKTQAAAASEPRKPERDGPEGPEPTRYGDWERKGICYDF